MSKEFVKIATAICPACGKEHSFNTGLLLNRRMAEIKNTLTGMQLCEEHYKEGYITLVEVNSDPNLYQDSQRTGGLVHLRKEAFRDVLSASPPDTGWAYVLEGLFNP